MLERIAYAGIACSGFLLLIAFLMRLTKGLFVARLPYDFIKDINDPKYENERRAGMKLSNFVFKYVPPFLIGFVLILVLSYLL